jgi:hypothetical protein
MVRGKEVAGRIRKSAEGGIPWMAILDSAGKPLVTSDGPQGNIGYPAEPGEIDHFIAMVKATAKRLTAAQIAEIRKALEEAAKKIRGR